MVPIFGKPSMRCHGGSGCDRGGTWFHDWSEEGFGDNPTLSGLSDGSLDSQRHSFGEGRWPSGAWCENRGLRRVRLPGSVLPRPRSVCILMLDNGTFMVRGLEQSSIDGQPTNVA